MTDNHPTQFVRGEAQGSEPLEGLLKRLHKEPSEITHRESGRRPMRCSSFIYAIAADRAPAAAG